MNRPLLMILIAGIGFAAGALTVRLLEKRWRSELATQAVIATSSARIAEAANTLTLLRRGEYAAVINDKEGLLSHEIFALASTLPHQSLVQGNPDRAIKMAKRYRDQHPFRTGEVNIDQEVERVLAQVPPK